MRDYNGFIQLHRKMINWEWYTNANVLRVFLHCLLNANYEDKKWQGILIKRGSFLTSYPKLAQSLKLSEMQIRNALNKLKITDELTVQTNRHYSIITIKNWNDYQKNNSPLNRPITDQQQTDNRPITPTNNNNKDNNDNNKEEEEEEKTEILKNWYGSEYKNVYLTDSDYTKLLAITLDEKVLNQLIDDFSQKIAEGKEQNWSCNNPQIHYARLKAYWKFRRNNPDKFKEKRKTSTVSLYSNEIED